MNVFDKQPTINDNDRLRLKPLLTGWMKLNEVFLLGISDDDLKRLVLLELEKGTGARKGMLRKLIGRLYAQQRKTTLERIDEYVRTRR